jgi:hypothetical protein
LAGFVAYATLRFRGLEPGEIAVFTTDEDPAAVWRRRAAAIRQRRMRSESDGHCAPRGFPGLAVHAAVRRRSVAPLVATALDRYRPSVEEFLAHLEELRARGADYLAFPATSLWWLDRYAGFGAHLRDRYEAVVEDDAVGVVFALAPHADEREP